MTTQATQTSSTVWSIDARTIKYYHLATIESDTPYGHVQCAPITITQGVHKVTEWRVWSTLVRSDNPDENLHIGYVQIHPNSVPGAVRYRIKHNARQDWECGSFATLYHAGLSLQTAEIVRCWGGPPAKV